MPVILTGLLRQWPASATWTAESLRARFAAEAFHVGGHTMGLADFFDYCGDLHSLGAIAPMHRLRTRAAR